jgi:hypothetical protein
MTLKQQVSILEQKFTELAIEVRSLTSTLQSFMYEDEEEAVTEEVKEASK